MSVSLLSLSVCYSGSMQGARWNALLDAFSAFLQERKYGKGQGFDQDLLTVCLLFAGILLLLNW